MTQAKTVLLNKLLHFKMIGNVLDETEPKSKRKSS